MIPVTDVMLIQITSETKSWQAYLVGLCFNWSGCIINMNRTFVAKSVSIGMFVSIAVCLAIVIAVPASSPSHTSPTFIFTSTDNVSGWNSKGIAFLAGLINANYSFGLIDSAVHLAEDIKNPERNVPKALFFTVGIGFVTAWPLAILLMYCLTDFEEVVSTATGVPLLELFYISFNRSKAGAVVLMSGLIVCWTFAMMALHSYQSKICWAFARDNGLPLSKIWSRVHPTMNVPLHALILCAVLVSILSALCIASTTAFNR
jgi:choline transport protein